MGDGLQVERFFGAFGAKLVEFFQDARFVFGGGGHWLELLTDGSCEDLRDLRDDCISGAPYSTLSQS